MAFLDGLQAATRTCKNRGFVPDPDPYASKSESNGIPASFVVADLLAAPKSRHHIKNESKYSVIWVGSGRFVVDFGFLFPQWFRNMVSGLLFGDPGVGYLGMFV